MRPIMADNDLATTLKEQKEAFVTGHDGTTSSEILLVCLSAPLGIFLFIEIQKYLHLQSINNNKKNDDHNAKAQVSSWKVLVMVEAAFILLPMAICQTTLLYPYGITMLVAEAIAGICLHELNNNNVKQNQRSISPNTKSSKTKKNDTKMPFLTSYRAIVSYLTFVAILAVDFRIFPRRFAKTETTGCGLMDLGAASFVISGGFVSRYARSCLLSSSLSSMDSSGVSLGKTMRSTLIRSIPLVILGFVRLLGNKGLDYQEHVSEYGVHWNFFFTLAIVGLLSLIFRSCMDVLFGTSKFRYLGDTVIPWMFLGMYQVGLSHGLQSFIENGSRYCTFEAAHLWWWWGRSICDFVSANREGVFGSVGYLALYCISEQLASFCLWRPLLLGGKVPTGSEKIVEEKRCTVQQGKRLFVCSLLLWILYCILDTILDISVSRRSTNASFVIWALAHNTTILFLTWLAFFYGATTNHKTERTNQQASVKNSAVLLTPSSSSPPIFEAVNRNGLVVFLLANLMTGAVNLSMNTLEAKDVEALGVIFCYLCAVGAVALILDKGLDMTIKLG